MPLRRRLGWAAGGAVGVAVILAAVVCYFVVRDQLRGQIDTSLRAEAGALAQTGSLDAIVNNLDISPQAGGPAPYAQIVNSNGQVIRVLGADLTLPVTSATIAAANGHTGSFLSDTTAGRSQLREITIPAQVGFQPVAVQLARPLDGVDHVLSHLRLILLLVAAFGVALAAGLGRLAADRVIRPLAEVSATADLIGETDDLSRRIDVHTEDEVGQLAGRFNAMLERLQSSRAELDASMAAQRQLVADASHELRTPVTSLRTNIEVLLDSHQLDPEDRRQLMNDVVEQADELTALVNDLIETARGDLPPGQTEDVRLDRIVEEAVARARRNTPHVRVEARLEPVAVEGVAERLHRVVNNLLDNAARHSPDGGLIEVDVDRAGLRVRDHGHGIDEQDLPYVFDRFYRGANSRGRQGSGLGLAIVKQVVEQHGGTVSAANAPDGGAVFTVRVPTHAAEQRADEDEARRISAPLF